MRKRKSIYLTLVFLMSISAVFLSQTAEVFAEPAREDIVIEAEGGFGGIAKLGAWSPVTVKIRSLNRSISGEIEIEVYSDQESKVIISKPVELIAGNEQEIHFEIPVVTAKRGIEIRLTENKKVQAKAAYTFKRLLPPNIVLIGVLSEDSEAFNWLNGNTVPVALGSDAAEKLKLMIASGQIKPSISSSIIPIQDDYLQKYEAVVVPLDRNTFPEMNEVMEGFDILIISKYDTSLLNNAQISVLEDWVETGGLLVTGTGISWQKVYHGLPDSLKPFSITGIEDVQTAEVLEKFTGREAEGVNLKLAKGNLGFEYIQRNGDSDFDYVNQSFIYGNYVIAGDMNNPIAIKYGKDNGTIVVLTFDPTIEPFTSWHSKTAFMENIFRYASKGINERFYEYINGYYRKYAGKGSELQDLATNVPFDKVPPFMLMFIILGVYILLAGPVLYIVLKILDRRDLAWVLIPALSVLFLSSMYFFGFKTRYNTAIVNTASLVEIVPGSNEANVSSAIGIFNNRRGTLTIEYDNDNGIQLPFTNQDNYYRIYGGAEPEGKVVAKYTTGNRNKLEQYDVALWTPKVLYAQKTIPFDGNILNNITIKDGKLKGIIENSTPYDLLDAVIIIGNNIIRIGDIVAGDSATLDIPFDSDDVYKLPEEYLDAMYGKNWYNTPKEYPENFRELNQKRRLVESYLYRFFSNNRGRTAFTLLAINEQEFDYGLTVNEKEPQKYNKNVFAMESALSFEPGQEIEIPAGIVIPSMYQENDIAWYETDNSLMIRGLGDLEFEFVLPSNLAVSEMRICSENYVPLSAKYRMSQDASGKMKILSNKYKFYLYNVQTKTWDEIQADTTGGYLFDTTIKGNTAQYIGSGNEVRVKISVTELGQPDEEVYYYYDEVITIPEIYLKGVSK